MLLHVSVVHSFLLLVVFHCMIESHFFLYIVGLFLYFIVTNKGTMKIFVQEFLDITLFLWSKYLGVEMLAIEY